MRKTTTVPSFSLCLAGLLAIAAVHSQAADPVPTAASPKQTAQAAPVAPPASVPKAPADSAKPAADSIPKAAIGSDTAAAAAASRPDSIPKDSLKAGVTAPAADSAPAAPSAAASDSGEIDYNAGDTAQAGTKAPKKRQRIVRETTVNTIDEIKGKYRSPKKALFMSLVVPGLGQAYVGQHWANYARGAAYFLADVALVYGWHQYVGVKQDRQVDRYRAFADKNWRQYKYEDSIQVTPDLEDLEKRNAHRETYCEAVQERVSPRGQSLYNACKDPESEEYDSFETTYDDRDWSDDSVSVLRRRFPNTLEFYEMIGKEQEFITGWLDADSVVMADTGFYAMGADGGALVDKFNNLVLATTPMQQEYIGMRAKANDYARMQAYFLGGLVINHIVSALDAALTAHYHNKALYQTEVRWWNRLHLDSQMAWENFEPKPMVTAYLTF